MKNVDLKNEPPTFGNVLLPTVDFGSNNTTNARCLNGHTWTYAGLIHYNLENLPCVSGSFTSEDMIGFADWCRNGLENVEYSIDKINEHLEAWILQHRKDVITLKIEFEDWHYQCGDKC